MTRRFITGGFDALVEDYDRFRTGYSEEIYDSLREAGVSDGASVVDVGCGTGIASEELVARGYRVTGVDISESMLERARVRVADAKFIVGHAEALPCANNTFDAAISAQAFHWFDQALALAELVRVVRPGGTIAIWWKTIMRGDAIRVLRNTIAQELKCAAVHDCYESDFAAFDDSLLVDQRMRVIPWIVSMPVKNFLGYERSRLGVRTQFGAKLPQYFELLEQRLGDHDQLLSISYVHYLHLGRVPESV